MSVPVEGLTPAPPPPRTPGRLRAPTTRPAIAVQGLFIVVGFVIAAFFPFLAIYLKGRHLDETQIGFVIASIRWRGSSSFRSGGTSPTRGWAGSPCSRWEPSARHWSGW